MSRQPKPHEDSLLSQIMAWVLPILAFFILMFILRSIINVDSLWVDLFFPPVSAIVLALSSNTEPGKSIFGLMGSTGIGFAKLIAESGPRLIIITAAIAIIIYSVLIVTTTTTPKGDEPPEVGTSPVDWGESPLNSPTVTPTPSLRLTLASIPTSIEIGYIEPTQITVIVLGGDDLSDLLLDSPLADARINVLSDGDGVIDNDPFCVIYVIRGGRPREPLVCSGRSAVIDVREEDVFWYATDTSTQQDITLLVNDEEVGVCTLNERQRCEILVD